MELLTEKQVAEMIIERENNVKIHIDKIKEELRSRKELKRKLEEAKQREALQLQILERLEESEKMIRKELDLVAKFEDNESLKQLELIRKYEEMLNEQQATWKKYKNEYESLPSVKELSKAEAKHLYATIKHRLILQKIKDTQRMVQLRNMIRKRQEQLEIIKFARLYTEHMKRQNRCQELWYQNKKLTEQAQQLRLELREKEKVKQQKLDVELKRSSVLMKPQQLPQVDLSRFIIHRDKEMDKLDTMSINSYILEEEYMNNNGQSISKLNSSQSKAMDVDNQDTMHMDIDIQEIGSQERELVQSKEAPRRLDFKGSFGNEGKTQCTPPVGERNNNEMQNHMQSNSSNQSQTRVDEHNRTPDPKMHSQESNSDTGDTKHLSKKPEIQNQDQNKEITPMNASFANNKNIQNDCSTYDRLVPTPAKMTKSSYQMKHPHKQSSKQETIQHQNHQEMTEQNQQVSKPLLQEIQQQNQFQQRPKRSSPEMTQQQQSSRHPSQETFQQNQQQVSREVYQQNLQQQRQSGNPSAEIDQQHQHQQKMYLRNEQRQASQQLQSMQVSPQNLEQMDFSEISPNKSRVLLNEKVSYDLQTLQRKQTIRMQPKVEAAPRTSMETSIGRNTPATPNIDSTLFAQQVPLAHSSVNVSPMSADIEPSSMMSTTMHSVDNYYLPDNISAILGSEITEPGGSLELARRLHDSDLNSDDGDLDYGAMMRNLCSPLHNISPKVQHPQKSESNNTQPPLSSSINQNTQDLNNNDRSFTFGGFLKKQTNTTHRFF